MVFVWRLGTPETLLSLDKRIRQTVTASLTPLLFGATNLTT